MYHLTSIRMDVIKKSKNKNAREDVGKKESCCTVSGNTNDTSTMENNMESLLKKIGIKLPCVCVKSLQSCLIFCEPMDCSLPGSSVLGIFQARILE